MSPIPQKTRLLTMAHITHITQGAVPPHPIHQTVIRKRCCERSASYLPDLCDPGNIHSKSSRYFLVVLGTKNTFTLPETNIAPENRPSQKETSIQYSNHQFSGAMFVSGRVSLKMSMSIGDYQSDFNLFF